MIDTHCHLTFPELAGRVEEVLDRARDEGVTGAITVATSSADCAAVADLAERHDRLWCAVGVHPLAADEPQDWEALRAAAASPRCVAWGELGLDHHHPQPDRRAQRALLEEHLTVIASCDAHAGAAGAPRAGLPIVLHCRDAYAELIELLGASGLDPARFVFHCFTGTVDDLRAVLDFGAMVSFTGVVTYRNAAAVQAAARFVPADRFMVETDAPYLSPEPHRGVRPCEPWMAAVTARALAQLRGQPWDDFHDAVNQTTRRFFGIEAR